MTSAILDANVIVQAMIGSPSRASAQVLAALRRQELLGVMSPEVLGEYLEVLTLPQIRERHGHSDSDLIDVLSGVAALGLVLQVEPRISPAHARDLTDTKYLDLALTAAADFLVTNDRRHLLRLKRIGRTRIVSPRAFLRHIE
jgi:uncharacterized protein